MPDARASWWTRLPGVVLVLLGAALAVGGGWLLSRGGSAYYLPAGLAVLASGIFLLRGRRAGLALYALFLLATLAWAIFEVRFDWWQLLPRLDLWFLLGLWLLLPPVNRRLLAREAADGDRGRAGNGLMWSAVALCLATGAFALTRNYADLSGQLDAARMTPTVAAGADPTAWSAYGQSSAGDRFAPARQITPANADRLQLAWIFHTGDFKGPDDPKEYAAEVTPLKANGLLYLCTPHNVVIALDPDSGRQKWRFDPGINRNAKGYQHMICRGVAYYDVNTRSATPAAIPDRAALDPIRIAAAAACPRRIYAPTADATIVAINADTGAPCRFFGNQGVVDLKVGHGLVKPGYLNPTSPPLVTRHVLIAAASVTDNASTDEPSGVIMGFDIDSGALVWNFDSGNPTGTAPLPAGGQYVRNSPNSWSVASADEDLGLAYFPMGNQTPDIWGGNRQAEGERFNSSILALDIASGRMAWVYQTVHHDLWDMDVGGQPSLVDLDLAGGKVPALIASTKRGDIYVLDRRDGHLLVPAPEQAVPQGASKGDHTAPTQPFSALSFKPEPLREADMWGTNPFDQLACRLTFRQYRYDGIFTPPSEQGSIVYPGNYGVFDWGGISIDPTRQLLIGNPGYFAFVSKLYPRGKLDPQGDTGKEMGLQPMAGTPYSVDLHPLQSPFKFPCQAPPWGYVAAVDLKTMRKVWMHKNGTVRDQAPLPIPLPLGVPSLGGTIVTGGGVAFLSGTLDYYLRAYDVGNGRVLWKARLPGGGQATPMSYISERSGRQYVVVMAGGHGSLGTKLSDQLVAYALPPAAIAPAKP